MLALLKRGKKPAPPAPETTTAPAIDAKEIANTFGRHAAVLGREAAEVRGVIDDTTKVANGQAEALRSLGKQLHDVVEGQGKVDHESQQGLTATRGARDAVQALGTEVAAIVDSLREVAGAAGQITQIALQTRLVAFNASVEAKRAGDAGRGFGVVADAVKDLAAKVETSSKEIMGTVGTLEARIDVLARETMVRDSAAEQGAVHQALARVEGAVGRIVEATAQGRTLCTRLDQSMQGIEQTMQKSAKALESALGRTETFLKISEQMLEAVAECGIETADTPYIQAAQAAAAQISKLLEDAVRTGTTSVADLFDERYVPVTGSSPAQHMTRFVALADRLFPQVQEKMLTMSDKVVFCIAADRNGYIACHNQRYNNPQRPGDTVWNTANCRNRRIFNDRTGLASGRNQRPFLVQTYRRDMGGGEFIVMKEVAAPIRVGDRHWGGVRLAYKF